MGAVVRVMLAEDVRILRETLTAVLDLEDDIEVVAGVERGDEVVQAALSSSPDVAVIDIDLPGVDGITAAAELHRRVPGCATLVLTGLNRPGHLGRALDAGVAGFLLKHAPSRDLLDAIRKVATGGQAVDPQLAVAALRRGENPITPRETDVLRLAGTGAEPDDIAGRLHLSTGTVRNYLTSAITKLGARNRVDAIRIATDEGWL